jgi:polar amino acid transport system substrate-binding protein
MQKPKLMMLFVLFILSTSSYANEKNVLRVGVEDMNYYPVMDFTSEHHRGLFSDIFISFAQKNQIALDFIPLPLQRFNYWFKEYAIDLRLPDNPRWTHSTSKMLIYSDPLITVCDTTVVLAKNRYIDKKDISTLGLPSGFTVSEKWQAKIKEGTLKVAYESSIGVLTQMLLSGMVDAIDLNIATIEEQLKRLGHDPSLVVTAQNVSAAGVKYAVSTQSHPSVITALNQYIKENRHTIDALAEHFGVAVNQACN